MKKLYTLILIFVFSTIAAFAQVNNAQNILNMVAAKARSAKTISANFTLNQFDKYKHPMNAADGFVKIKGNKYYIKQEANEVICNGTNVWNFDGDKEVMVSKASDVSEDDFSPEQILTGFNTADFTSALLSSNINFYQVLVKPVDKRKNFNQIVLFISKSTHLITKAIITDKINSVSELSFSAVKLNETIPDTVFNFDVSKHPGVEVINQ